MEEWIISVTQLNEYVKKQMHQDPLLRDVCVRGEISGFKRQSSGHMYFFLKDASSRVSCVMFRSDAATLNFVPTDGMQVLLNGYASLYNATGTFQIYGRYMRREGKGDLYLRFEELKSRLMAQGMFDPATKRQPPLLPKRVGIVTSLEGAALRDMVRVINRRFPGMPILICPASVQGENAPSEIADAIEALNRNATCDVILCGRGGGSMEDLMAFNDETVARAIFESDIPVISCVGHETDTTIADFVADVRAATPSMAAELAVPDAESLRQDLLSFVKRLERAQRNDLAIKRMRLSSITQKRVMKEPVAFLLEGKRAKLKHLADRRDHAMEKRLSDARKRFDKTSSLLKGLDPKSVMKRGYAVVEKDGKFLKNANEALTGDALYVKLYHGRLDVCVLQSRED